MLLIGNLVALVGSLLMVSIGFIKDKKKILTVQCLQFGVLAAANLLLGAYAGAVSNGVSIVRNLAFFKVEATTPLKVFFVVLQLGLTLAGGVPAPIELLPILSTVIYTCSLDMKSIFRFKFVLILTQSLWVVYDFYYQNYAAFVFDLLTVSAHIFSVIQLKRDGKEA
ncbi:MAG: YgjV family protein [Clostridiales bacterium]|nr:YgjV family protein [Clostridiales bacterium]MCD7888304.1 YgjV family protein [Clostridiales bacterium]